MNQELANGAQNWDNRVSITPSGFFGSSTEMIQARENFMTKEELDFLLNSAKSITTWDRTETHYNENGTIIYDASYWDNRVASRPILDAIDTKKQCHQNREKFYPIAIFEMKPFFSINQKINSYSPDITSWHFHSRVFRIWADFFCTYKK